MPISVCAGWYVWFARFRTVSAKHGCALHPISLRNILQARVHQRLRRKDLFTDLHACLCAQSFPRLVSIKDGPIDWGVGVVVKFDKRFTDRVAIKFGISSSR